MHARIGVMKALNRQVERVFNAVSKRSSVVHRLHWTALFFALAVAPFAAEASLRRYVSYVTKRVHMFRSDAQTGWSNTPEGVNRIAVQPEAFSEVAASWTHFRSIYPLFYHLPWGWGEWKSAS
jgi:hypothetical protein